MAKEIAGPSGGRYGESERVREQVSLLLGMLDSQYREVRASAIVQLSRIGEPAVPVLVEALREGLRSKGGGEEEGRRGIYFTDSIVRALGIIGSPSAVDVLSRMLDESGGVHSFGGSRAEHPVAEALGKIGTKEAVEALARNAHKKGVFGALSRAGGEGTAALRSVLEAGNTDQKAGAARALGEVRDKSAVPSLVKILQVEYDERAWNAALDALLAVGDASVVPALLAAWRKLPLERATDARGVHGIWLRSTGTWLRFAEVVAKLGGASAVPDLLTMTAAADYLKGDMKASIVNVGEPAIPALAQALQAGTPEVQTLAAELIADIKAGGRESGSRGIRRY